MLLHEKLNLVFSDLPECVEDSNLIDSCWEEMIHRSALAFHTIILHDNITELRRSMYLNEDPSDCFHENTRFSANRETLDMLNIMTEINVASPEKCHEFCLKHRDCVMFFLLQDGRCNLRRDRVGVSNDEGTTSGLKHCGTLYYESTGSSATGGMQTATFSKNLDSVSMALSDGSYKVKRCHLKKSTDCFVLIKFKA